MPSPSGGRGTAIAVDEGYLEKYTARSLRTPHNFIIDMHDGERIWCAHRY